MTYFPKFYIPLQVAFFLLYICLKQVVSCSAFVQLPHMYFVSRLLHQRFTDSYRFLKC